MGSDLFKTRLFDFRERNSKQTLEEFKDRVSKLRQNLFFIVSLIYYSYIFRYCMFQVNKS